MAQTTVRTKGAPDLRMLEIDHPLGGIDDEELAGRIEAATTLALELIDPRP